MARWKLTGKHYLNVPGTEWEYEETTATGKRHKQRMPVPLYLDPDDREYQNQNGEIIVAWEGSEQRGDITFVGPPTQEMTPLDEEAEAISAELEKKWSHPIESLPSTMQPDQSPVTRRL
jgi:hypothetical protein